MDGGDRVTTEVTWIVAMQSPRWSLPEASGLVLIHLEALEAPESWSLWASALG